MSAPEPDRPGDPAEYRPKPLLGFGFWAALVLGVLAVLAGVGVVLLGPRLLPGQPAGAAATPPASSTAAPLDTPPPARPGP